MFKGWQSIATTRLHSQIHEFYYSDASYKYQYTTLLPTTQPGTILNREIDTQK